MRIPEPIARSPVGHTHFWERAMSRRVFLGTTAAAGGAAITASMWTPLLVEAANADPTPIPETIFPNTPFHVQFPIFGNELSTINNFKGVVAVAAIAGTGTSRNANGARKPFFFDSDQRFMQGTYIGVDGHQHKGTFGFVWLDVFSDASHLNQTNDFDLGIHPYPGGIFWTVRMSDHVASADVEDGEASYRVHGMKMPDYGSINNALAGGSSVPARASFQVDWGEPATRASWSTSDFAFHGMQTNATIEWSASEAGSTWESDEEGQTVESAFVGIDRNGVFR